MEISIRIEAEVRDEGTRDDIIALLMNALGYMADNVVISCDGSVQHTI